MDLKDIAQVIYHLVQHIEGSRNDNGDLANKVIELFLQLSRIYNRADDLLIIKTLREHILNHLNIASATTLPTKDLRLPTFLQSNGYEPIRMRIVEDIISTTSVIQDETIISAIQESLNSEKKKKLKTNNNGLFTAFNFDDLAPYQPLEDTLVILRELVHPNCEEGLHQIMDTELEELIEHPQWFELICILKRMLINDHRFERQVLEIFTKFMQGFENYQCLDSVTIVLDYLWYIWSLQTETPPITYDEDNITSLENDCIVTILSVDSLRLSTFQIAIQMLNKCLLHMPSSKEIDKGIITFCFIIQSAKISVALQSNPTSSDQLVRMNILIANPTIGMTIASNLSNLFKHGDPISILSHMIHTGLFTQLVRGVLTSSEERITTSVHTRQYRAVQCRLLVEVLKPFMANHSFVNILLWLSLTSKKSHSACFAYFRQTLSNTSQIEIEVNPDQFEWNATSILPDFQSYFLSTSHTATYLPIITNQDSNNKTQQLSGTISMYLLITMSSSVDVQSLMNLNQMIRKDQIVSNFPIDCLYDLIKLMLYRVQSMIASCPAFTESECVNYVSILSSIVLSLIKLRSSPVENMYENLFMVCWKSSQVIFQRIDNVDLMASCMMSWVDTLTQSVQSIRDTFPDAKSAMTTFCHLLMAVIDTAQWYATMYTTNGMLSYDCIISLLTESVEGSIDAQRCYGKDILILMMDLDESDTIPTEENDSNLSQSTLVQRFMSTLMHCFMKCIFDLKEHFTDTTTNDSNTTSSESSVRKPFTDDIWIKLDFLLVVCREECECFFLIFIDDKEDTIMLLVDILMEYLFGSFSSLDTSKWINSNRIIYCLLRICQLFGNDYVTRSFALPLLMKVIEEEVTSCFAYEAALSNTRFNVVLDLCRGLIMLGYRDSVLALWAVSVPNLDNEIQQCTPQSSTEDDKLIGFISMVIRNETEDMVSTTPDSTSDDLVDTEFQFVSQSYFPYLLRMFEVVLFDMDFVIVNEAKLSNLLMNCGALSNTMSISNIFCRMVWRRFSLRNARKTYELCRNGLIPSCENESHEIMVSFNPSSNTNSSSKNTSSSVTNEGIQCLTDWFDGHERSHSTSSNSFSILLLRSNGSESFQSTLISIVANTTGLDNSQLLQFEYSDEEKLKIKWITQYYTAAFQIPDDNVTTIQNQIEIIYSNVKYRLLKSKENTMVDQNLDESDANDHEELVILPILLLSLVYVSSRGEALEPIAYGQLVNFYNCLMLINDARSLGEKLNEQLRSILELDESLVVSIIRRYRNGFVYSVFLRFGFPVHLLIRELVKNCLLGYLPLIEVLKIMVLSLRNGPTWMAYVTSGLLCLMANEMQQNYTPEAEWNGMDLVFICLKKVINDCSMQMSQLYLIINQILMEEGKSIKSVA